jgi:molecular chaperone GrpE
MTEDELKEVSSDGEVPQDAPPQAAEELPESDVTEGEAPQVEGEPNDQDQKVAELETRLAEAEQKTAEYLDGWQRAQAAFSNFRKRNEAEQAHWRSTANAQLLMRLLPILDDFRRAFETIPEDVQEAPWLGGIRLIERKVNAVLESENVTTMALNPGDAFDPHLHEAVLYQEVDGFGEGEVVTEIETGYLIGDRVLRPALVVVAKAPAAPPESERDASAEGTVTAAQEQREDSAEA